MRLRWTRPRLPVPRPARRPAGREPAEPRQATAGDAALRPPARNPASPLNDPVWRLALTAAGGCAVAFAAGRLLSAERVGGVWAAAAAGAWAWLAAARLLLVDARHPRFWSVYLGLSLLPVLLTGARGEGWIPALLLTAVFIVFRRHRFLRHLTPRRRMWLFFLALGACLLTAIGWAFPPAEGLGAAHAYGQSLLRYALGCLDLFWIVAAFHLVLGMRLHFMRLRPKLLASALLVAVVPLVFVLLQGVAVLFGVMGGTLATGGRQLLRDWAGLAVTDPVAGRMLFATTFTARQDEPAPAGAPAWLPLLWRALQAPPPRAAAADGSAAAGVTAGDGAAAGEAAGGEAAGGGTASGKSAERGATERGAERRESGRFVISGHAEPGDLQFGRRWTPADSTFFLRAGAEVWALRLRREGADSAWAAAGYLVDEKVLTHLATVIRADVGIRGDRGMVFGDSDDAGVKATLADTTRASLNVLGRLARPGAAPDSAAGFWRRPVSVGAAILGMLRLRSDGLVRDGALLHVRLAPADVWRSLASSENEFNQAVLAILVVLAFFLLLFIGFAVLLGVRIASGITSAVEQLHEGTVHLAEGDLDTRIEVPNEDEFGDLADSFNAMTAAVKRGREEAIERERLERELRTAREIQERLLPHAMPDLPGYEVTGTSVPSLQVGGDYFDFLDLGDGRLGVAIADVAGKGIPAALLMANLQALLQGQVIHPSDVAEIVARINDLLTRATDVGRSPGIGRFATFFYGVLERESGAFTFTNAGHNPPLLRRADGTVIELKTGGLIMGLMSGMPYAQETIVLEPGDVVVMFTDGITEAQGPIEEAAAAEAGGGGTPGETGEGRAARRASGAGAGAASGAGAAGKGKGKVAAPAAPATDSDADEDEDEEEEIEEPVNLFGEERLQAVLAATAGRSAGEIRAAILEAVRVHAAGIPPSDDITLVVIRRQS